jgi:pimeloyl-ACP methyl ester carboxylesterase
VTDVGTIRRPAPTGVEVAPGQVVVSWTLDPPTPPVATCLLVPPFAASADDMFTAAYVLYRNGVRTVCFDPRDHVGASTGEVFDFHLSTLVADATTMLDRTPGAVVVGFSLAARALLRALRDRHDQLGAVLVTPVVDMESTLVAVVGDDYFVHPPPPTLTFVGCELDGPGVIADCRTNGFVTVDDAIADALAWRVPLRLLAGDGDPWVRIDQVRALAGRMAEAGGDVDVATIPAASHQLNRNPVVAMRYLAATTAAVLRLAGAPAEADDVVVPAFSELIGAVHAWRGTTPRGRRRRA